MSTSVAQLPVTSAQPGTVRHDEDQIVADVLSEMQMQKKPVSPQTSPQPAAHVVQQYILPSDPPTSHGYPTATADTLFGVLDKTNVIRAALAAIVALMLFYPESFSSFYEKIPTLGVHMQTYDKLIRAALLAVLLYVMLWKLDI